MKVYTKTGDRGDTGLSGGSRVAKTDLRIRAIGEVDELNSCLGWACIVADDQTTKMLTLAQNLLFEFGAMLSCPPGAKKTFEGPTANDVSSLEHDIDATETHLEPLRSFILPGGTELAARIHFARSVCRRAERAVLELHAREPLSAEPLAYLNRLSDWLFVRARLANKCAGIADVPWSSRS